MDIRFMERKQLEKKIKEIEDNIFAGEERILFIKKNTIRQQR